VTALCQEGFRRLLLNGGFVLVLVVVVVVLESDRAE
jgi:hypothetical protein